MEEIVFLEIILAILCLYGLFAIGIFFVRKKDSEIDVNKWITDFNNEKNSNLNELELGNKKIDEIEKKILVCKKKLNMKLFDK